MVKVVGKLKKANIMYSLRNRLNAVFGFACSVLAVMLALNSLSVILLPPPNVPISFTLNEESTRL